MSTLSEQCEVLRLWAKQLREGEPILACDLREAADTILNLRELVRDVYTLHRSGLDCTECPWFEECNTTGGCPWLGILADHMRDLGVEVEQ